MQIIWFAGNNYAYNIWHASGRKYPVIINIFKLTQF